MTTVDELKRAWEALGSGAFSQPDSSVVAPPQVDSWQPSEPVTIVAGVGGGVGTTTVALALATSIGDCRVVECAPIWRSGLASAAAESGGEGVWRRGTRGRVFIERPAECGPEGGIPVPLSSEVGSTVLDVGTYPVEGPKGESWLRDRIGHSQVVVVVGPTVPCMRQLSTVLESMSDLERVSVACVGSGRRKWARSVVAAAPPDLDRLEDSGRFAAIPYCRDLAVEGITDAPLPESLLAAIRPLSMMLAAESTVAA